MHETVLWLSFPANWTAQSLDVQIALPSDLDVQLAVADALRKAEDGVRKLREQFRGMGEELEDLVGAALHYVFRKR